MAGAALLLLQLVALLSASTGEAALYSGDSPVRVMNESEFRSEVINSHDLYLVEFFADWCGHCQQFAPAFESVAKSLRGIVSAVALREERGLMQEFDVKGFPTVMVVVGKGGDKPKTFRFEGQREAPALLDFVLSHVGKLAKARMQGKVDAGKSSAKKSSGGGSKKSGPSDVLVLTDATFEQVVMKDDDSVWFVEFYAPWCGHCKALAPIWEEVATALKGKVKVAKVDATVETTLSARYSIQGFPTLKLFPAGRKSDSMVQDYQGPRMASSMVEFALTFYSKSLTAEQLLSEEAFRSECEDGLCIIAFLPDVLDSGVEGRRAYIQTLTDAAKANATVPVKFFWLQGGDNFDVEESLQLAFGWPAVVAVHLTKEKFSTHRGDFSKESISLFVQQLLGGRAPVRDLPKLKKLKTVAKWRAEEEEKKSKDEL